MERAGKRREGPEKTVAGKRMVGKWVVGMAWRPGSVLLAREDTMNVRNWGREESKDRQSEV